MGPQNGKGMEPWPGPGGVPQVPPGGPVQQYGSPQMDQGIPVQYSSQWSYPGMPVQYVLVPSSQYYAPATEMTWPEAIIRTLFSFRFPFMKLIMFMEVVGLPVEAAMEFIPVVDVVEDGGLALTALRLLFAVHKVKKGK